MGMFDKLFGSKTKVPEVRSIADPYGAVRESLNNWLTSNIGKTNQYEGERVAGMTDQEKRSLTSLDEYANRKTPETTQAARSEVLKTLSGNYDPSTSPYYQAVKAEAARNLQQQNDLIASNAAGGGRYYSGGRMREQREAGVDMGNRLNTILGQQAENERQRMMQSVNQAQSLGNEESQEALNTTAALQQYGSLPRQLQQAALDKMYEEWNAANREYPLKVAELASGVQQEPLYGEVTKEPSTFMKMYGEVNPFIGSYNTGKYGYTYNQDSMKELKKMLMQMAGGMGGGIGA